MVAGFSTPLQLAASLLSLATAAGVGIAALSGALEPFPRQERGRPSLAAAAVALGAALLVVGHGLAGAFVVTASETAAWLRAAGLVVVALGLRPARWQTAPSGPALVAAVAPLPAAVVAGAGGLLGAGRALRVGRSGVLIAVGLAAWGAAELLAQAAAAAGAWASIAGSVAVGGWLWQRSRRRLRAKFATAFVATLLGVIVLVAALVSGIGAARLVDEEVDRLGEAGARLAEEIGTAWPRDAVAAARPLRASGRLLLDIQPGDEARLREIANLSFRQQDFFALLGPDGRVVSTFAEDEQVVTEGFVLALTGAEPVARVLEGVPEDGQLRTIGGRLVAIGAVRLAGSDRRAEDPPLGALVTGRVVDEVWAARAAAEIGAEVLVQVPGAPAVASSGLAGDSGEVADALEASDDRAVVELDDRTLYAAGAPVRDLREDRTLAEVTVLRGAAAIAGLERAQARQLFLVALVGAALAGAVGAAMSGRLVAPLQRLTAAAAAVREGDLQAQVAVRSADEVGVLGQTFDEMTTSLAEQSAQLRAAADEQARLRARLEALTASMSDALVAVDRDGAVITFNPAAERLVGVSADEASGAALESVLAGAGPDGATAAAALGPADSDEAEAAQLALATADGREVPVAATAAPVRDDAAGGAVLGRVFVLRDITREVEVERMKADFLANVSHELRTPLTPIKGYAEVIARRELDAERARIYASHILDAAASLERIVAMIVDFAALDSGQVELRAERVPLGKVVDETLADWRARHPDRVLRRRLQRGLPPVEADPALLRRCLDELVDNAVKFSPEGAPVVVHGAAESDGEAAAAPGGWVRLSVTDRGVGLDADRADELFADFHQADASETRRFGGLGLGLALVQRICLRLGGEVGVESEPGRGTTVHLRLPAADEQDRGARPTGRSS